MALLRALAVTRFARPVLVAGLALGMALALRGEDVRACAGGDPAIESETTFDPGVIGEGTWPGLYFDPHVAGYGDRCEDCLAKAVAADWRGYLGTAITDEDWHHVLYDADAAELGAIAARLAGKPAVLPKGLEKRSLWSKSAPTDKLRAAVAFVQLARRVEAVATFDGGFDARGQPRPVAPPSAALLADARAAFAAAPGTDPFLRQRYGLQLERVLFYRSQWSEVEALYDKSSALLLSPSADLAFRARYYYAGALRQEDKRARANVELARIVADDPALAGVAMRDFQPMEDLDWKKALVLAGTPHDKAALWRLVGIKADALTAVREIVKLDPKSNLIGLLLVRALASAEQMGAASWGQAPDASVLAAQKKAYAALEQLAGTLVATPGIDSPWLPELVLEHIAARRGDVAGARAHAQRALAAHPTDPRVTSQVKASLAVALVMDWKINPAHEEELAQLMAGVDADKTYGRTMTVRGEVRGRLAKAYAAAGDLIDAELLVPGTIVPIDEYMSHPMTGGYDKSKWTEAAFLQAMLARFGKTGSAFDKFVLQSELTRARLETDIALRKLLDADYAGAAAAFAAGKATSTPLHTDPFVIHINDCHDCDHDKYATAPWTHATFVARLGELARAATGTGEAAADASLQLGIALYNITWFGNARVVLDGSHEETNDAAPAERWFKRAYDLTKDRERKARAAYLAAKAERAEHIADAWRAAVGTDTGANQPTDVDTAPTRWYGVLKQYASTKYYREVLKECGYFAAWIGKGN